MDLNGDHLILLPTEDSKSNYLEGFWRWVEILANNDYQLALESLYWPGGCSWTPESLKHLVTTFFGGDAPWSVVIPNERLIHVINDAAESEPRNPKDRVWIHRGKKRVCDWGWLRAQIPLTTEPHDPKNDEILLMGLASSFLVHPYNDRYVLEHEIFHV